MFRRKEPFVRTLFFLFNILRVNNRRMDMTDNTDNADDGSDAGNTDNTGSDVHKGIADNTPLAPDTRHMAIVVCPSFIPPLGFHSLIAYAPKENVYRRVPSIYGQTQ